MMVSGTSVTYVGGTSHRPLPRVDDNSRRNAHTHQVRPKSTGLDWDALTPTCAGCGQKSGQLGDGGLCPPCRGVVPTPPKTRKSTYAPLPDDEIERRFTAPADPCPDTDEQPATATALEEPPAATPIFTAAANLDAQIEHASRVLRTTAGTSDPVASLLRQTAVTAIEALHLHCSLHLQTAAAPTPPPSGAAAPNPAPKATRRRTISTGERTTGRHKIVLPADEVIAAYQSGMTLVQVAEQFGCSHPVIARVLDEHGVVRRGAPVRRTDEFIGQVRNLYIDEGLSQIEVAARLGVSAKVVQAVMVEAGIPSRPAEPRTPVNRAAGLKQQLAQLAEDGITSRDIKTWAVSRGLVDRVTVGLPAQPLVDAYLEHHQQTAEAS